MTHPLAIARRLVRRLTPILGLLLLVILFTGGTHHHADGQHHVCAVCTVVHTPAIASHVAAPCATPSGPSRLLHAPAPHAPRQARCETASSRAPPLA